MRCPGKRYDEEEYIQNCEALRKKAILENTVDIQDEVRIAHPLSLQPIHALSFPLSRLHICFLRLSDGVLAGCGCGLNDAEDSPRASGLWWYGAGFSDAVRAPGCDSTSIERGMAV